MTKECDHNTLLWSQIIGIIGSLRIGIHPVHGFKAKYILVADDEKKSRI